MWRFLSPLASPKRVYQLADKSLFFIMGASLLLLMGGAFAGLVLSPPDYLQGDGFRIMYVHVPSAFLGMGIYTIMAMSAISFLVWRVKIAAMWLRVSSQVGVWFTFLALFTGAVWGKPMWGTWWVWDARLTSVLILFFLYLGVIALQSALKDKKAADKAGCLLVLVGVINIPIIHFSVDWWNTLHQTASISRLQKPAIDSQMLYPLLLMIGGFFLFYLALAFMFLKNEILWRERKTNWVQQWVRTNE